MYDLRLSIIAPVAITLLVSVSQAKDQESKDHAKTGHEVSQSVPADKALHFLKNGNIRFTKGFLRKDGISRADIQKLSSAQHPHTIVLSCSDSRVPPEVLFDQKLGEIFVVRTAGEALEATSIASIEYAIEHLGVKNILVMGHTQCGAVKAALSTMGGKDAGSPNLNKLVADIQPRLQSLARKPASENFGAEGWANAKGVAQDLVGRSEIIAKAVKSGGLKISAALYNLHSGVVDFE